MEVFNRVLKFEDGIQELLKVYRAMPLKSGLLSLAEQFFHHHFCLNFELSGSAAWLRACSARLHKRLVQLKWGGFLVGDLVLT